jgi:hypothetical protein
MHDERLEEDPSAGSTESGLSKQRDRCPYCGGSDLVRGSKLGMTAEVGAIGPSFNGAWIFGGTEPLYVDLCRACGTVTRIYVKEPNRNWST